MSASLAAENRFVKEREKVLERLPSDDSPSSDCPISESSLGSGTSLGPGRFAFSRGAGLFCGVVCCCGGVMLMMMSSLLSDTSGRPSTPASSLRVKEDGLRRRPFRTFGSYTGCGFNRNCPAVSLPQSVNVSAQAIGGVAAWMLILGTPRASGVDGGSVAAASGDRSSVVAGGDGGSLFAIASSVAFLGVVLRLGLIKVNVVLDGA